MVQGTILSYFGRMGSKKKGSRHTFYTALLAVFLIASCSAAGQSRFLRVLSLYKYSVYLASDRDVLCNFDYAADENRDRHLDLGFDTLYDDYRTFDRTISGMLSVRIANKSGKKDVESSRTFEAGIRGNFEENSSVRSNALLSLSDSIKEQTSEAEIFINYSLDRKKHFGFKNCNGMPFWTLQGSASINDVDERYKQFSSMNLSGTGRHQSGSSFHIAQGAIGCAPSIGWGWPVPVWPVYYAFEIERKLKESGALTRDLSDTTLLKIACHVATQDAYTLKYDLPRKYFMAGLDTLLREDSALDLSRQGLYGAFKVDEAINHSFPVFFSGFSAELFLWERIIVSYEHYYYLYSNYTGTSGLNFDQENSLGLRGSWGFPVTGSLFGRVSVSKLLLNTEVIIIDRTWDDLLTWDWDVEAFWFITNRFLVSAGLTGLDVWVFMPKQWPQRSYLDATVFLEDHFRLTLSLSKTYLDVSYGSFMYYRGYAMLHSSSNKQSDNISLRLDYDF